MAKERKCICSCCNKEFMSERDIEDVLAEKEDLFKDVDIKECVVVCNDCFINIMDFNEPGQKRYLKYI